METPPVPADPDRGENIQGSSARGAGGILAAPFGYFRSLWRGEFPLERALLFDMLIVGTVVNVLMVAVTVMLFAADTPTFYGVIVYLLHLPYSILVFIAVMKAALRAPPLWSNVAQCVAVLWLVGAIVL